MVNAPRPGPSLRAGLSQRPHKRRGHTCARRGPGEEDAVGLLGCELGQRWRGGG